MIHRIALLKLNANADASVIEMLQTHVAAIRDGGTGARSYDLVPNLATDDRGFNWAILSSFDTVEDMERYKDHPLHKDLMAATGPYEEDFIPIGYLKD